MHGAVPFAYRPDIDGLRAIAVLAVMMFHAVPALCPGGFVGVDVFFVISGYLVTAVLLKRHAAGEYSVCAFYLGRAKRILPALIVVLTTCIVVGFFILTPGEYRNLGKLAAANSLFIANILMYRSGGYFDIARDANALLHTWSLNVEEQFYLVWPLLLMMALRRPSCIKVAAIALSAASFALACYWVVTRADAAFFLLPARAWELSAGALVALGVIGSPASATARHVLGLFGIALIVGSAVFLDSASPFPAWNALWACTGTVLVITCGADPGALSRRMLKVGLLVWVGTISYSLYLWHWPLLTFLRLLRNDPQLPPSVALLSLAAAFVLSALSWKYVEQPFRRPSSLPRLRVLARYALAGAAMLAVGTALYIGDGLPWRVDPAVRAAERAADDVNPLRGVCVGDLRTRPVLDPRCIQGAPTAKPTVVVWGDSHADAIAPAIAAVLRDMGSSMYQVAGPGCAPLLGVRRYLQRFDAATCVDFNQAVMKEILGRPELRTVILSARWAVYSELSRLPGETGPRITSLSDEARRAQTVPAARAVFTDGLKRTVHALHSAGRTVIVIGAVPEARTSVPACLARNGMRGSIERPCAPTYADAAARFDYSDRVIAELHNPADGVCAALPSKALCREGRCLARTGDVVLYSDDDHLSNAGAEWLLRQMPLGCL